MRAFSLGQPSRGATRRSSSRPKLAMARATMPMLSASCGSIRITAGVSPSPAKAGRCAGAADAVPQLAQHAAGPEPVLLAGPSLGELFEACCRSFSVPRPAQANAESGHVDFGVPGDETSKDWTPSFSIAKGNPARGIVRLAAPLGAIGQDRLHVERSSPASATSTRPTSMSSRGTHARRPLRACPFRPPVAHLDDDNADQWDWTSRNSRMWPITSAVF